MISNKLLKENQILFKQGDPAKSMYIIRRGSVKVYIENGKEEIILAVLKEGAIMGEMAFFDQQPRSASIKTLEPTEVTEIEKDELEKLSKQMPKWLLTMLQSLSLRLRQTNEKLQEIESLVDRGINPKNKILTTSKVLPHQKYPYEHTLHALKILLLSLAKDGEKDEKNVTLLYEHPKNLWDDFYHEEFNLFDKIILIAEKTGFIGQKNNWTNQPVLVFYNRGGFAHFINTFANFAKKLSLNNPFISDNAIQLLSCLVEYVQEQSETNMIVSLEKIKLAYKDKNSETSRWDKDVLELKKLPTLRVIEDNFLISIDVNLKENKQMLLYLKYIKNFYENNLA